MKKNLITTFLFIVFAAFSFSNVASAQARGAAHVGGSFGGQRGGYVGGNGNVGRGYVGNGGGRGYVGGNYGRGGYDYRYYGNRYYGGRGFGYGFGLGFGLGYFGNGCYNYGNCGYNNGYYVAPQVQYYVDQNGNEYFLDAYGRAVFTGRVIR